MVRILEVHNPLLNTYPGYGILFSVIGNNEHILEWAYNNFVQLQIRKAQYPYKGELINLALYDLC